MFWFEIFTPEVKGGKGGNANFITKHTEPLTQEIYLSPVNALNCHSVPCLATQLMDTAARSLQDAHQWSDSPKNGRKVSGCDKISLQGHFNLILVPFLLDI